MRKTQGHMSLRGIPMVKDWRWLLAGLLLIASAGCASTRHEILRMSATERAGIFDEVPPSRAQRSALRPPDWNCVCGRDYLA